MSKIISYPADQVEITISLRANKPQEKCQVNFSAECPDGPRESKQVRFNIISWNKT